MTMADTESKLDDPNTSEDSSGSTVGSENDLCGSSSTASNESSHDDPGFDTDTAEGNNSSISTRIPQNLTLPPPLTRGGEIIIDVHNDHWKRALSPDGKVYFYNVRTRESSWNMPISHYEPLPNFSGLSYEYHSLRSDVYSGFREGSAPRQNVAGDYSSYLKNESFTLANSGAPYPMGLIHQGVSSTPIPDTEWVQHVLADGKTYYSNTKTLQTTWELPIQFNQQSAAPETGAPKDLISRVETVLDKQITTKPAEKSKKRPVTADPIPGTCWYLVLTGEGRHFYYDHRKRKSFWVRPDDLDANPIVDAVLDKYDEHKKLLKANNPAPSASSCMSLKDIVKAKLSHHTHYVRGSVLPTEPAASSSIKPNTSIEEENITTTLDKEPEDFFPPPLDQQHPDWDLYKRYTHEEKVALFNQLLLEKKVSAFAIYENEALKLEEDPRFKLFPPKERKQIFNDFLKSRVNEEKEEKISEIKKRQEDFRNFLSKVVKSNKLSYSDLSTKYFSDPRFRVVKKDKERESLFQDYIAQLTQASEKEAERSAANDNDKLKHDFFQLLSQVKKLDSHTPWRRVKRIICDDEKYIAVSSSKKREDWFDEFIENKVEREKQADEERMKIEREKASIREREKKVLAEKKQTEASRTRERETYLHESAVVEFCSLLTDMINNPKIIWTEAKNILKHDPRWRSVDNLSRDEYHNLFDNHVAKLYKKQKDMFHKLLDEADVHLTSTWNEIYPKIKDDARYSKFSSSDRKCRKAFERYIEHNKLLALDDLRNLLIETKLADHKFLSKCRLSSSHRDELIEILKKDSRYNVLDFMDEERERVIRTYLEEVERKGTPPPPTATIPTVRFKNI